MNNALLLKEGLP